MSLTKLDQNHYIDLDQVAAVLFDPDTELASVHLVTGGSLALQETAAQSLQLLLGGDTGGDEEDAEQSSAGLALDSRKKGWFVITENNHQYILAAVNAKGSCSLRIFDGDTGVFRGKQYKSGNFREQFPQLRNARQITVAYQPNLERDCRERIPEELLKHLREQFG
jgi:hypothetical protein